MVVISLRDDSIPGQRGHTEVRKIAWSAESLVVQVSSSEVGLAALPEEKRGYRGWGVAIIVGYLRAVEDKMNLVAVMAGDNQMKLPHFPSFSAMIRYSLIRGIKTFPLLAYMDYSKEETKEILRREVDWVDYGGHHFESLYTRFVITDILWEKFGIDKRKVQLSAAVRSGKITRDAALAILASPPQADAEVTRTVLERIGITEEEFREILALPPKTFLDYPTTYPLIRALKWPIKVACSMDLLPEIFYEKYLGART